MEVVGERELIIHAYDWTLDDNSTKKGGLSIYAWALDRDSVPHLLRFEGFPAFCYIELPFACNRIDVKWTKSNIGSIMTYLSKALKDKAPIAYALYHKKKLYYYKGDRKYPMILIQFKSLEHMFELKRLLEQPLDIAPYGKMFLKVWEADISTILKMLCLRKCNYSQWFSIRGKLVPDEDKISTLDEEYLCRWDELNPISPDETRNWMSYPRLLSFDIEVYSDNHNAMPVKYAARHCVYMISITYGQLGHPETRFMELLVSGDYPDIEGIPIIRGKDEVDLIRKFEEEVIRLNPDIMMGYNIFSFDYPYLDYRLRRNLQEWKSMGRLVSKTPRIKSQPWKSRAFGQIEQQILILDGRLNIDVFPLIRREHKLPKYDLDYVSNHFLGRGKHPVKAKEMFKIYEELTNIGDYPQHRERILEDARRVGRYACEDSSLVFDLFERLNMWISLVELSNSVLIPIVDTFTRGQQIRCIAQIYRLASDQNYVIDARKASIPSFSGGFVGDPSPGLYEWVMCIDFNSLYPSIIEESNICYTTLIPTYLDKQIKDEDCKVIKCPEEFEIENEGEDEPKKKNKKKNVSKVLQETIHRFSKKPQGILPQLVHQLVSDRRNVKKQLKAFEGKKNLTPEEEIINIVLDRRQWGLKISANSVFGFLGASEGKMPLPEGARSITARGRDLIKRCNQYLEETYNAKIVYNDTDSSMFVLPFVKSNKECIEWGLRLEMEVSDLFDDPLNVEFEKGGRVLLLKKKKYAFWPINKKTYELSMTKIGKPDVMYRGIILARRDNCLWQRRIYGQVLQNIITLIPMKDTLDYITQEVMSILTELHKPENLEVILRVQGKDIRERIEPPRVTLKDLILIRELGGSYKSDTYFLKVFANELRRIGHPQVAGNRLEYLIVKLPDEVYKTNKSKNLQKTLVGYKMRLAELYFEERIEPIDVEYYLSNILMKCIDQLFGIGYKKELDELDRQYRERDQNLFLKSIKNSFQEHIEFARKNIIQYLKNTGQELDDYRINHMICQCLYQSKHRPKFSKYYSKYISHRGHLVTRLSYNPIGVMVQLIQRKREILRELKTKYPPTY